MKKIRHKITEIVEASRIGNCSACGDQVAIKRDGKGSWRCKTASLKWNSPYNWRQRAYIQHRKGVCTRCGFVPEDECQLDVHHKDGNFKNNHLDNLVTVCANCHRFLTRFPDKS